VPGLNGGALADFFDKHAGTGNSVLACTACAREAHWSIAQWARWNHALYQRDHYHPSLLTAVYSNVEQTGAWKKGGPHQADSIRPLLDWFAVLRLGFCDGVAWENPSKIFGEGIGQLVMYPPSLIWWYRIQTVLGPDNRHNAADVAG